MRAEEKKALGFTTLAIIGFTMVITMLIIVEFTGPYKHRAYGPPHFVKLSTPPAEYPSSIPFAGVDCLTMLVCGLGGLITSSMGISYVFRTSSAIRLPIRLFCYVANCSWLIYCVYLFLSTNPMPEQ